MRRALTTLTLLILPLAGIAADVYRSVDAQGHVQYSDVPSPGAQLVSTADNSTADNAPTSTSPATPSQQGDQISQRLAAQAAARQVAQDTAQTRAEQCKQAQEQYQKSIDARHIYRTDASGNREYLSDQEADQQRVNYRLAMEAACKEQS